MRWIPIIILFLSTCFPIKAQTWDVKKNQLRADSITVSAIKLKGNKKTRDKIVFRELEFQTGDQVSISHLDSLMVKSSQNLMNRSLFNFVTITKETKGDSCTIVVDMTERWYIWPIPIIDFADRNVNAWWETKDFSRLNYGVDLRFENFRGRMEYVNLIVQAGYDKKLALKWTIPYLTPNQNLGMSIFGGYQLNKEIPYALDDNKPIFYSPQDGYAQQWGFGSIDLTYRQKFNFLHTVTIGYDHYLFADSLSVINPEFAHGRSLVDFFSIGYLYKQDFRDYSPYPLKGYYFDASVLQRGLGIVSDDFKLFTLSFVFDQYINIYKRWYFAYNVSGLFASKAFIPYFLRPGFGYKDMEIRGYEYYVISGQYFGLARSNFKFEIIPRKEHRIKWIKTEKFGKVFYALYANLFFDMGYAYEQPNFNENRLANQLLYGTGLGIDFVTYYDLVIRFEYTINKQREHGFFINLVAPI